MTRILAAFAMLGLVAWAEPAGAYCRYSTPLWNPGTPIRVIIHDQFDENFPLHGDGAAWTRAEIVLAVQWAISYLNESASADIPFIYLDTVSPPPTCPWAQTPCVVETPPAPQVYGWYPGCYQPNTVVLVPTQCDPTGTVYLSTPTSQSWAIVFGPNRWDHGGSLLADSFESVLVHELAHVLGLGHPDGESNPLPYVCSPAPSVFDAMCTAAMNESCSVMTGFRLDLTNQYLSVDDQAGLRAMYGHRTFPDARNFEDDDLDDLTYGFGELAMSDIDAAGYFAASTYGAELREFVTIAGYSRAPPYRPTASGWRWSNGTVVSFGAPTLSLPVNGLLGAAENDGWREIAAHVLRDTADARRYRRRVSASLRGLGGGSWITLTDDPIAGSLADTTLGGVSVAFDPASGAMIHAIRSRTGLVQLIGLNAAGAWGAPVNTGIGSFTSPAIACSPSTCFLAVVERPRPFADIAGARSTRIRGIEFHWCQAGCGAGGNFLVDAGEGLITSSWNVTGGIAATAVPRAAGGTDFVIASNHIQRIAGVWATRTYAYRHIENTATITLLVPEIAATPLVYHHATMGGASNYAEVFTFAAP